MKRKQTAERRTLRHLAPAFAGVAIMSLLALTGCSSGGSGGSSGGSGGVTTIKVLNWEPGGTAYWKAAVAAFEKDNPDIKVSLETVPNDKYAEVQGPYITSKSGPDVMENNAGLELFDRRSAYVPIPADARKVAGDLLTYSGACLGFDIKQDCYGLPFSYQGNVMYYNKTILKAAGLDANNPPKTWDEMDTACQAVKAIGDTCLALGMTGQFPAYWDFPEVARNFLTEADMRAVLAGKMKWTDPKMVEILSAMADISKRGWINKGAPSISMLPDAADIFQSGKAAFAGTIISDAVNWSVFGPALGDKNLGAMSWPMINPNAPLAQKFSGIEGSVMGVTQWSTKKDAAFKFVKWMAGPENAALWSSIGHGISLYKNVEASSLPNSQAYAQILKIIKQPTLHVGVMLSGQEADAIARGWQQVTLGKLTVKDWSDQMQTALQNSPSKNP
ncbi:MAG: ABC transporter substrate-binding protein [Dermatophilaceae bacterium]